MRDSAFGPPAIPPGFWARPEVRRALAARDMGELFRLLCQWTRTSQMRIGTATGMAQGRISDIVRGKYRVKTVAVFTRIADGLDMPDQARILLGVAPAQADARAVTPTRQPGSARKGLALLPGAQYPATTGQALTALTSLWRADAEQAQALISAPLDPAAWNAAALAWLLSQPDPALPEPRPGRAVGLADVARVQATAKLFAQLDNRFGGAHARRALIQYLRDDAADLLAGQYTDDVGRELFAAVAEASLLAAWASYDCGLHGLGQRYFVQALRLAESAADRRLACSVLSAMSHQATFLGYLADAANLARAAQQGVRTVATPTLTAQFQAMEARALARLGDTRACERALAATERSFGQADPGQDPDFISYFNEAELAAEFGHCFRDLGQAGRAVEHAARAVASSDGEYPRSDFFVTMVLADGYADQGDPEQACQAALRALHLGEALTSARCAAYMREFRQRLERFDGNPAVRDFQDQAAAFTLWAKAA
jgi:hypothetical protein